MSQKFNARALETLEAIYRFVGGLRGLSRADLASPLTFVHGVQDSAAKSQSLILALRHSQVTDGASNPGFATVEVAEFFDGTIGGIAAQLARLGRRRENTDVYLMAVDATLSSATAVNISRIGLGGEPPNTPRYVSPSGQPVLLLFGTTEISGGLLESGGGQAVGMSGTIGKDALRSNELPMAIERVSVMGEDDAVGAITITWTEVFAFVPIHTAPPTHW